MIVSVTYGFTISAFVRQTEVFQKRPINIVNSN